MHTQLWLNFPVCTESLLGPSILLTLQHPPCRTDAPLHFSFIGIYFWMFWFEVNEASHRSGFTPQVDNPIQKIPSLQKAAQCSHCCGCNARGVGRAALHITVGLITET